MNFKHEIARKSSIGVAGFALRVQPVAVQPAPLSSMDYAIAEIYADDPAVLSMYAAPEWCELGDDGKAWVAAIVRAVRQTADA